MTDSSGFEVALSSKGLGEAELYDKERFTFVVGNVQYKVSRLQACFLSGKVRRLIAGDATIERLLVNVEDDNQLFDDVVSLMNGRSVIVNDGNSDFLQRICVDLENHDLLGNIFDEMPENDLISVQNAVNRLRVNKEIGRSVDKEVEFIALHFNEVVSGLESLCDDDIDMIFESQSLKLVDEESLFAFLISRREVKTGTLHLLRHGHPEFLPEDRLGEYLSYAKESGLWDVWDVICECVYGFASARRGEERKIFPRCYVESEADRVERERVERERVEREQDKVTEYKGQPFDGIIGHFRSGCGGNVHENGIINITASGNGNCHQPYEVAGRNWSSRWYSSDSPNSWLMFDFKDSSVCPTHYSLRYESSGCCGCPIKWQLGGSDDIDSWTILDNRETHELARDDGNGDGKGHTFTCRSNGHPFRYLRLTHTGKNLGRLENEFRLSEVEFFGTIRPRSQ